MVSFLNDIINPRTFGVTHARPPPTQHINPLLNPSHTAHRSTNSRSQAKQNPKPTFLFVFLFSLQQLSKQLGDSARPFDPTRWPRWWCVKVGPGLPVPWWPRWVHASSLIPPQPVLRSVVIRRWLGSWAGIRPMRRACIGSWACGTAARGRSSSCRIVRLLPQVVRQPLSVRTRRRRTRSRVTGACRRASLPTRTAPNGSGPALGYAVPVHLYLTWSYHFLRFFYVFQFPLLFSRAFCVESFFL